MSGTVASAQEAPQDRPAVGLLGWAERGLLPDAALRYGIRRLCAHRLREELQGGPEAQARRFQERIELLRRSPVAIHTDAANAQHYELPPAFFQSCLGRRMKYSGCLYPRGDESLDEGEEAMLRLYDERAQLADDQDILELGCGWGSLTLWMAERYPNARITAVSNSRPQRAYIETQCQLREPRQRAGGHGGCQSPATGGETVRSMCLDRDVRAHAQLRDSARSHRALAAPRRQAVRARILPPHCDVPVRD